MFVFKLLNTYDKSLDFNGTQILLALQGLQLGRNQVRVLFNEDIAPKELDHRIIKEIFSASLIIFCKYIN